MNSTFYEFIKHDDLLKMLLDNYKFYVENINNRHDQNFMQQAEGLAFAFAVQINIFLYINKN